jgi:hypothetical protein
MKRIIHPLPRWHPREHWLIFFHFFRFHYQLSPGKKTAGVGGLQLGPAPVVWEAGTAFFCLLGWETGMTCFPLSARPLRSYISL